MVHRVFAVWAPMQNNPRNGHRAAWFVLSAVVLVQAAGLVLTAARDGTALGSFTFLELLWPEPSSQLLERAGVTLAVLASAVAVFARSVPVRIGGAAIAAAFFAFLSVLESRLGGAPFASLALPAHATRIAAPLVLATWSLPGARRWILRGAVAITFAIHGLEALWLHPGFVDFLLIADLRLVGAGLDQHTAEILLRAIGIVDLVVAALLLTGRDWRPVLGWLAFWGFVTAGSRMVQGGEGALHHTLIRAANGGLALVLLLCARNSMNTIPVPSPGRIARLSLPVALFMLVLPFAAGAQSLSGNIPAHLRIVWTEDPSTKATVSWSTSTAGSSHEVYLDTQPRGGNLGAYAHRVPAQVNGPYASGGPFYHHAQLTGLRPATTYYFVLVSDGNVSTERHFVTAHEDDRNFRLMFGGDSRTGVADRRKMNQLMAHLTEQDPGIAAFAHGGDYIDVATDWSQWGSWLEDHALTFTASGRVLPIIPARGNHEGDGVMYNRVFGFPGGASVDYFTTRLGEHVTFITLDSNSSMGGDQRAWLEQQLQAAQSGRWIIPSYHRPAYPAVKTPGGAKQFFVPLFEKYDVDVVCESDGHALKRTVPIRNDRYDPTGIVYVGEGGLGVPQRAPIKQWFLESPGMAKSAHHVQLFSFSPEQLVYEARLMTGKVDDTYTFHPRRTPVSSTPAAPPPGEPPPSEAPPPSAPQVTSVASTSETAVRVTFSTDVDPASAAVPAAYALSPAVELRDVAMVSPRVVALTTGPMESGREYVLTVSAVRSTDGTPIEPVEVPFQVGATAVTPPPVEESADAPGHLDGPGAQEPPPRGGCQAAGGLVAAWSVLVLAGVTLRRRRASRG
jgi:hypothetical protein